MKKNWNSDTNCIIYNTTPEIKDHSFLSYPFAQEVWKLCTSFFNSPALPNSIDELFIHWSSNAIPKKVRPVWNILAIVLCWLLWKGRNKKVIQSTVANCASLVADSLFFIQFWSGASAKKKKELLSTVDLHGWCYAEPAGLWIKFDMMVADYLQHILMLQFFQWLVFFDLLPCT